MILNNKDGISDLLCLVAGLLGGVVRVFNVRVCAGSIRVLDEDVQVILPIHQNLIFYHSSFLQILQLLERHLFIVKLEHALRFLRINCHTAQH